MDDHFASRFCQLDVSFANIATDDSSSKPEGIGRAIAYLASHRATGHISGAYASISVPNETGAEDIQVTNMGQHQGTDTANLLSDLTIKGRKHRVRIALSVDFDAISAHLGTGKHPNNNMADYSQGIFAGKVGAPRLLRLFKKLGLADKMTWFIPGHSMETFPAEVQQIVESGCEIALHGYSHEVRLHASIIRIERINVWANAGRLPNDDGARIRRPPEMHRPRRQTHR